MSVLSIDLCVAHWNFVLDSVLRFLVKCIATAMYSKETLFSYAMHLPYIILGVKNSSNIYIEYWLNSNFLSMSDEVLMFRVLDY